MCWQGVVLGCLKQKSCAACQSPQQNVWHAAFVLCDALAPLPSAAGAEALKLCYQCKQATTTAAAVGSHWLPAASILGFNWQSRNTAGRDSCSAWVPGAFCGLKRSCADDGDDDGSSSGWHASQQAGHATGLLESAHDLILDQLWTHSAGTPPSHYN